MSTVDLRVAPPAPDPPAPAGVLGDLPRRVGLTLPELRLLARAAGDAPLPFASDGVPEAPRTGATSAWVDRLGGGPGAGPGTGPGAGDTDDAAHARTLAGLPDAAASLGRRGLLVDGVVDAALRGAVGLLAAPAVALDLTVAVGGVQAAAWHRLADGAVAALSTVDGVVFELAWFPVAAWPGELARVASPPEDEVPGASGVPRHLALPLELADAAGEAQASGRGDLLPELVRQAGGAMLAEGEELDESRAVAALHALHAEPRGRLRALVAEVCAADDGGDGGGVTSPGSDGLLVGVRSWLLVADGWRSLRVREAESTPWLAVEAVEPTDLAGDLAPLLAEVDHGWRS